MVGVSRSREATPLVASVATLGTDLAKCGFGLHLAVRRTTHERFARKLTLALEDSRMTPEFYLVLDNCDFDDEEFANAVFEAGFDDCEITVRGDRAAIWICHRKGEFADLARKALAQATAAGISVHHVELENEVFA